MHSLSVETVRDEQTDVSKSHFCVQYLLREKKSSLIQIYYELLYYKNPRFKHKTQVRVTW